MNNNINKLKTIKIIIISFSIIIILISVIISIINQPKKIEISNKNQYFSNTPSSDIEDLEIFLYTFFKNKNVDNLNNNIQSYIRENTFQQKEIDEINVASFLLDIDELQQTIMIEFSWPKEELSNISIFCPQKSQSKYPQSTCDAMYDDQAISFEWKNEFILKYIFGDSANMIIGIIDNYLSTQNDYISKLYKWNLDIEIDQNSIINNKNSSYSFDILIEDHSFNINAYSENRSTNSNIAFSITDNENGINYSAAKINNPSSKQSLENWYKNINIENKADLIFLEDN